MQPNASLRAFKKSIGIRTNEVRLYDIGISCIAPLSEFTHKHAMHCGCTCSQTCCITILKLPKQQQLWSILRFHLFFDELNKVLGNELSISYREIECGCEIFYVHDEGGFFLEECCVSSSGGNFEDVCEDVYDTISDAIEAWCEKTGITQGKRTVEEMVDFINDYEYDTEDTYYYIHPFEFD